ncbi:MAG: hypothetical protein ACREA9_22420 [Pyrinomonadaceae bacterium]
MRSIWRLGLAGVVVALVGCGGGGGGGGIVPAPANQSASGIWNGTLSQGGAIVNDATCLVTEAKEAACILIDPANGAFAGAAHGTVQVANVNQISGSGTAYAAPGYVLADGSSVVANFTISSGTVSERNTINLVLSSLGQSSTFSGTFDPIYDRDSSLATVAGSYAAFDVYGDPASFSIDSNGALFSQSQSGCVGNGQVSIIDSRFNGYAVDVTVSNCPGLNGSYSGLAVTLDFAATNDVFLFGVFNSLAAILGAPVK